MIHILSVLFFVAVFSNSFCRHLENTLSDARTIRKTNTIVDGNVLSDDSLTATVSDDTSNSIGVLSNVATPIEERFSSAPLLSPSSPALSSGDAEQAGSLDLNSQQKEVTLSQKADSTKETITDTEQQLNPADKVNSDNIEETKEDLSGLIQSKKDPTGSVVAWGKESEQSHKVEENTRSHGHSQSETPSIPEIPPPITTDSERDSDTDYDKNHGQTENVLTSDRSVDTSLVGNKLGHSESDLPYVKLDNVNDKNIEGSSPVVRPELNHLDGDADKVQSIEISTTENDISPSSISEKEGTNIEKETQNVAADKNPQEISSEPTTQTPEPSTTTTTTAGTSSPPLTTITTTITTATTTTSSPLTATDTPQTADNGNVLITTTTKPAESDKLDVVAINNFAQLESVDSNSANTNTDKPEQNVNQDANIVEGTNLEDIDDLESTVTSDEKSREPDDVDPLDIFVDDIKFQRFPDAMPMSLFKEKIAGKTFKKLYILESAEKKLFQHVRQLEVTYLLEEDELYAEFLFRFIYSRQCTRIEKFKLGTLAKSSAFASFEKDVEGGKTERLLFFSRRPDDYVFFMSCTDLKTSPYACRDTYYVTLDSRNDPPNQFPWLEAASELESEMKLTFEDPRFIFNFVMMPCARA